MQDPVAAIYAVSFFVCPGGVLLSVVIRNLVKNSNAPWVVKMAGLLGGSTLTVLYFYFLKLQAVKASVAPLVWLFTVLLSFMPDAAWMLKYLRKITEGIGFGDVLLSAVCCTGGIVTLQAFASWCFPQPEDFMKKKNQRKQESWWNGFLLRRKLKKLSETPLEEEKPWGDNALERILPKWKEQDGVLLGIDMETRKEVYITPAELNHHTVLAGTTGSGKTTTIMTFLEYALKKGQAIIVVDGKGKATGLPAKVRELANRYGREVHEVNLAGTGLNYDPFGLGTPTELTDKLMAMTEWTEDHYRLAAREFLQYLFRVFEEKNITPTFQNISEFCSKDALVALITQGKGQTQRQHQAVGSISIPAALPASPDELKRLIGRIMRLDDRAISGLSGRLGDLQAGDLRFLFESAPEEETLELSRIIDKKGVAVFSLDSIKYMSTAPLVGRLVVNDIKAAISRQNEKQNPDRVTLIFDEFNVFVTSEIVDLVNKSRDAGFEALVAFQSIADIDRISEPLRRQITENCNTMIIHRQNDWKDAEEWAKNFSTKEDVVQTIQTDETGISGVSGMGSLRKVDEFNFHPSEIKALQVGVACVRRHTNQGTVWQKVKVRQVI